MHDVVRAKLCDLYENDSIFDRFECGLTGDSKHAITGSYNNFVRISAMADDSCEVVQADKSLFRSKKSSKTKVGNGSMASAKSRHKLDEMASGELDLERKIQHLAVHPRENTVALAALSNLFVFSQL